ncbi:U-box domain-containing protein 17 [Magnolia sinica]|uniref:U-box domain-containing protein 17 n=1 Tax=Magnolia sinica TaxID=86752 RepID=UPI0026584048|nr:U-box domain-containing protein 17 [Magnolia sinica]
MASTAIFSSLRRRRSPSLGAFFAPIDLADLALIQTLTTVSQDLISSSLDLLIPFQRRNSRSLLRKIKIFVVLFEFLKDSVFPLPSSATLCFKELYILIYRSKILLDYCSQSSRLWLLLQNSTISGHFHDLNQEISTLLDVFPMKELDLSVDMREQIELLKRQAKRSKLFIDPEDEMLRCKLFSFLDEFEQGRRPDPVELKTVFVESLGLRDARSCRSEIEFLEEQIFNQEEDGDSTISVISGFVALVRYCRFLIFGFEEELETGFGSGSFKKSKKSLICQEIGETFLTVPKDFCCPISLDLMRDPVIISTGQTYDRASISRWLEEGHCSCPKTGQMLMHTRLVPNRALRSLITQWCAAHGIPYDPIESADTAVETVVTPAATKAAIEANRATAELLVQQLSDGTQGAKTVAARELRLLAKTGKENRACIAEVGAIPLLKKLLSTSNPIAQENSVTAILNLSIHDKNKSRIMEEEGCLESVVDVLRHGMTEEARENAAATLFSLSAVHEYKKRITDEEGALEALAGLLTEGSQRGKKDAVTALFNLSTHSENCERMVEAGAVSALVGALATEGVAEEAAGALALLVRQGAGTEAVGREDEVVAGLIRLMRWGTPRGKENAVAALLEMCRTGVAMTERVVRVPALAGLLQMLLFTGTKRARRKAASLARVCQRCEAATMPMEAWGVELSFAGSSAAHQVPSFGGDVSVSVSVSVPISVPVL